MFKYLLYIVVSLCFVCEYSFAQNENKNFDKKNKSKKEKKSEQDAFEMSLYEFKVNETIRYINLLKNGALIVKIKSKDKRIQKYRDLGQEKVAKRLEKEVEQETKQIIDAFNKHYDFSKVYFMHSRDSKKLINGDKSGYFLNANLEIDNSIVLDTEDYLIFEKSFSQDEKLPEKFAIRFSETYKDRKHAAYIQEREDTLRDKTTYTEVSMGGMQTGAETYIVKNAEYEQLLSPFPHITHNKMKRGLPYEIRWFNVRFHRCYKNYGNN